MTTEAQQQMNLIRALEAVRKPNEATLLRIEAEMQKLLDMEMSASFDQQQQAEIYAENAWLRAAEAPTNDDLGFYEYEARLGLV